MVRMTGLAALEMRSQLEQVQILWGDRRSPVPQIFFGFAFE